MERDVCLDYKELWVSEIRYVSTIKRRNQPVGKYPGLRREDLYDEDYADVQEAVRRLPETEKNLRLYRIKRALDLTIKHSILPTNQWTNPEEVCIGSGLFPHCE